MTLDRTSEITTTHSPPTDEHTPPTQDGRLYSEETVKLALVLLGDALAEVDPVESYRQLRRRRALLAEVDGIAADQGSYRALELRENGMGPQRIADLLSTPEQPLGKSRVDQLLTRARRLRERAQALRDNRAAAAQTGPDGLV